MISETMSFVCSGSFKVGITREKKILRKVQENHLFECISGSRVMHWIFQVSDVWTNMWDTMKEEKARVKIQEAEFQERI